jgi:hypothetical protein
LKRSLNERLMGITEGFPNSAAGRSALARSCQGN